MPERGRRVVVIGGGIAGLSAALAVRRSAPPDTEIVVIEQRDALGGKIRTGELAGHPTELGAESFLVRRPEATDLAAELGLADRIRHPARYSAGLWADGRARSLPARTVMGVPTDADALADSRALPAEVVAAVRAEPNNPAPQPLLTDGDISVGKLVRSRLPGTVVDRLVDPLLGGVYAGRADDLSLQLAIPQLAVAARHHRSLIDAARAAAGPAATPNPAASSPASTGSGLPAGAKAAAVKPVFGSIDGGLSRLVEAVAAASGARIRLGLPVREIRRNETSGENYGARNGTAVEGPSKWTVTVGSTRDPERIDADAVVLAVPAAPAARLLADVVPAAAGELKAIEYASMALVALALPAAELPGGRLPEASGLLVPADAGLSIKAATYLSRKWPAPGETEHGNNDGLIRLRASIGRFGDIDDLRRDDAELVELVRRDLETVLGGPIPKPAEASVTRWGGGLPQYAPGHADRVRRVRQAVDAVGGLTLAGAAYDGVGIPACIASGINAGTAGTLLSAHRFAG